jgi:parvulin-like peptidyl-prolyl isomerase
MHAMILRLAPWFVLLAVAITACGGGSQPPAAPRKTSSGDSPANECLAIAGAKRDKRPDEPAKVTVRHVLVKYAGAKNAAASVTRSREEACLRAAEARSKLEGGATFAEIVKTYSDEGGAATREGMVGAITRGEVAPSFADAAFELKAGETSHVVESPFGFHVIQRSE